MQVQIVLVGRFVTHFKSLMRLPVVVDDEDDSDGTKYIISGALLGAAFVVRKGSCAMRSAVLFVYAC